MATADENASAAGGQHVSLRNGQARVADCIFCKILRGEAPATIVAEWDGAVAFEPLGPVTEGHVLVVPKRHTSYATEDPQVAGYVMQCAAEIAPTPCNLITSAGVAATQTIFHLHVHIVPRSDNDGLSLPWSRGGDVPV